MQKLTLQSVDSAVMEAVQRRYDSSTDMTQRLHYQIVMLAHRGRSVAQIVDTMFYSRDAVEYILGQFLSGGVDAIPRMLPQGIRRIEAPAWEAELLRIINMSPRSVGVDSERWTTRRAAEYLAAEVHVRIRAETISLFLHRHGYTCKNRVWRREHPVEEPIALLEAPRFKTNGLMDDDVMDN